MRHYDILGVEVDALTLQESLEIIAGWIKSPGAESLYVVKPYVEFMTTAYRHNDIRIILNESALCLADGVALQWAASYLYGSPSKRPSLPRLSKSLLVSIQQPKWRNQILPQRFAGITATTQLLDLAAKKGWRVGVIGGSKTPAEVKSALLSRWPELDSLRTWSGFSPSSHAMQFSRWESDADLARIIAEMQLAKLDLLLVGMGFPRQELFMKQFKAMGLAAVMVGEGGSFDYQEMGGSLKRSPRLFRKLNIEWLWRLVLEPRRITRQLAIPHFIYSVQRQARQSWKLNRSEK